MLKPTNQKRENRLLIKEYITEEPPIQTATPFNIFIYKAHQVEFQRFTSLSEIWARAQVYNKLNGFKAHYWVDNICAWNLMPPQDKVIKVVWCESGEKSRQNLFKLIGILMKELEIPDNQIFLQFKDESFKDTPFAVIKNFRIDISENLHQEIFTKPVEVIPDIKITLSRHNITNSLTQIQLTTKLESFSYRIWSGGAWSSWTQNQLLGFENIPIQGFQFDFNSDKYEIQFRCKLAKSGWTQWKNRSISVPYREDIQELEIKIEVKSND